MLSASIVVLVAQGGSMAGELAAYLRASLADAARGQVTAGVWREAMLVLGHALALPLAVVFLAGAIAGWAQAGCRLTLARYPGGAHLFWGRSRHGPGGHALRNAGASWLTVCVLVAVVGYTLWPNLSLLSALPGHHVGKILGAVGVLMARLAVRCAVAVLVLGVLDFAWRWLRWRHSMRTTPREARRAHKEEEGDPALKARRRQIHAALAPSTPWENLRGATFVVVDDRAAGCAIGYDESSLNAPVVLVRVFGEDTRRLEHMARTQSLTVFVDPVLIRTLAGTREGDEIPRAAFEQVARLLVLSRGRSGPSSQARAETNRGPA
jgi:flagellar biosynthesis protein FlhB